MAQSLERMRELEEQVKTIPVLQVKNLNFHKSYRAGQLKLWSQTQISKYFQPYMIYKYLKTRSYNDLVVLMLLKGTITFQHLNLIS